jgi:ABC-type antimicrobial peptide transport system permease subunit
MTLVQRPDPRKKLMLAAGLDFILVALGVVLFLGSGNVMWVLLAILVGAGLSVPLMISAMREIKEQNNASG